MTRTIILSMTLVLLAAAAVTGQEAQGPTLDDTTGIVTLTWDQFVQITGYDPTRRGNQTVTIPWSEVKALLGDAAPELAEGTTVALSWNEFKTLLEWSIQQRQQGDPSPPMDYIVTSSEYSGTLSADGATFSLALKLNVLREEGWKRIPVLPNNVALTNVALTPPEGVFLNSQGAHYELLTDRSGPIEAELEFAVSVQKEAGINTVAFERLAPGSSILDLTIDRENVDVKVAGAQSVTTQGVDETTKSVAAIPAGIPVMVSWERALPEVAEMPSKLYAETRTLVAVADGVLFCHELINVNILHSPVQELKLAVPEGASVLTVTGQNVQDWRVDADRTLVVALRGEVVGAHSLRVTYEAGATDTAVAPVLRALGVERERGFIGVVAVANVEIEAGEVTGATKIDARQLPADIVAMTNQPVLLAFRYVGEQFTVPLSIKKHDEVDVLVTIVDSSLHTGMQLRDGRRITKVLYSVRNNRNQFLRLTMPAGSEIWSVAVNGDTVSPATNEQGQVLIPLVRSASRSSELASFPVEIVYVEKPEGPAPASGELTVKLPVCGTGVPVMHVMYNLYLPAEGTYTGAWGASAFSGPLTLVEQFSTLSTGPGLEVVSRDAAAQVATMQQEVNTQIDAEASKTGATPIRVRLPLNGQQFRMEKILALPGNDLYFTVQYRGWDIAE